MIMRGYLTEEEFINKIDNNEELSENELASAIWNYAIETTYGDDHRWTREATSILKVNDRHFRIYWMSALTECQENEYWEQPEEVTKHEFTETITVTRTIWEPVNKESNNV